MDAEAKLKDLRKQFGKRSVLYADDMAELIGADHQATKAVKSGFGIPLPLKKVRGRYGVAIYDAADWLSSPDAPKAPKAKTSKAPLLGKPARLRPSLGKALLALRKQMDFLNEVYSYLEMIEIRGAAKKPKSK